MEDFKPVTLEIKNLVIGTFGPSCFQYQEQISSLFKISIIWRCITNNPEHDRKKTKIIVFEMIELDYQDMRLIIALLPV